MPNNFDYTFDDEVVSKFSYDSLNNRIEVYFSRYFDKKMNKFIETPCCWIIEKWEKAYGKLSSEEKFDDLEEQLGIFSLLLSVELRENILSITASTLDNRYIDLVFENPVISFLKEA
ncbi:MAG: hypothetical protein P0Y53_19230 [Candidatus Pseudobacter hemicellulosilyticus]|uniref:Uncharacterized protein n=1 Tax=Candidatus Pseudobacter hemicellulosilyticus TaxID=3121375 RepID=A0AAJ6BEI7_9BACT|nr:MAG: hypothetical protein P0Y53_19230 [Pseudobacter sp.]